MSFLNSIWSYIQDILIYIVQQSKPPYHVQPPAPVPGGQPVEDKVTQLKNLILNYNAPFKTTWPPVTGTQPNAEIHKITEVTALAMANKILEHANLVHNDFEYLSACIMQESRFDPACYNHNLKEYNGKESFEGTDWGCCQLSGYYLPSKPGMKGLTEAQMIAKATSPEWAVPTMAQVMAENLNTANNDIANATVKLAALKVKLDGLGLLTTSASVSAISVGKETDANLINVLKRTNNTSLSDPQFMATLYYNRGATGGLILLLAEDRTGIQHAFSVGKWYAQFVAAFSTSTTKTFGTPHEPFAEHSLR